MSHELKIVVSGETTELMEIYINDKKIELIQDIKLSANANEKYHKIEITFPNLLAIDSSQYRDGELIQPYGLQETLDLVSKIPYIKVNLVDFTFD